ncbi:hypothetical protein TNCV_2404451 [Trichonephila clavipes]|nr:hypothetical protein TNCV_2404451 [Trichonephila clavipes]
MSFAVDNRDEVSNTKQTVCLAGNEVSLYGYFFDLCKLARACQQDSSPLLRFLPFETLNSSLLHGYRSDKERVSSPVTWPRDVTQIRFHFAPHCQTAMRSKTRNQDHCSCRF